MQVLLDRVQLNRWDKDSIRPGPVGSVGDVNLQVKLKKSANYLPDRYQKAFSGKNEVWSGSNVSDGQWTGFTSGGRGALTISKPLRYRSGFKTPVGYMFENVVAEDRSEMAKMVPLGQYSWEQEKARIYKAKATGEQFLPLPMGYEKALLPRGSQFPTIVAESTGTGIALPAAEVNITDSQFGKQGSIEVDTPGCTLEDQTKVWVPAADDPRRQNPSADTFFKDVYPYRAISVRTGREIVPAQYPQIGSNISVIKTDHDGNSGYQVTIDTSPCGSRNRPSGAALPTGKTRRAKTGDYRREEQKREEEKRKQKMR